MLSGVVRDHDGVAQDRADVVLVDATGNTVATDRTEASGQYSLGVAAGTYDLAGVTADIPTRMMARVRTVEIGSDTTLDLVVPSVPATTEAAGPSSASPATVTWTGTVRHNGVPVRAETLYLEGSGMPGGAETDDDGRFELAVPPGHYPFELCAYVGTTLRVDSDPRSPGLHVDPSEASS